MVKSVTKGNLVFFLGCFCEGCVRGRSHSRKMLSPSKRSSAAPAREPLGNSHLLMLAIRAIYGAHWRAAHNNALRAFILSLPAVLRHSLDELPEGQIRQFCRVPGVAPPVSSVRTQTVTDSYANVAASQPQADPSLGAAQPLDAAQQPLGAAQPSLPMEEEEEQELQPGDEVYKL